MNLGKLMEIQGRFLDITKSSQIWNNSLYVCVHVCVSTCVCVCVYSTWVFEGVHVCEYIECVCVCQLVLAQPYTHSNQDVYTFSGAGWTNGRKRSDPGVGVAARRSVTELLGAPPRLLGQTTPSQQQQTRPQPSHAFPKVINISSPFSKLHI